LSFRAPQAGNSRLSGRAPGRVRYRRRVGRQAGRLQQELVKLDRISLIIVEEVGYIPFEAETANLFFQLVSSRYERASLIVTSNKPFDRTQLIRRWIEECRTGEPSLEQRVRRLEDLIQRGAGSGS
jgi:IstB-like ATP binding protein